MPKSPNVGWPTSDTAREGWADMVNAPLLHYIRDARSLCGRWGYFGSTYVNPTGMKLCKACERKAPK